MTSAESEAGRAALVSPGAALAPLDTEARCDYQQERIGLLAGLFAVLGLFFLIAGCLHQLAFFAAVPGARISVEPSLVTHVVLMLFQGGVWLYAQRRAFGQRVLPWLDAGLVLGTLSGRAYQVMEFPMGQEHQRHLLMILTTLGALLCRAVIVPSKPRTTLVLGCLGVIPALLVAVLDGAARGSAGEVLSFSAIWCASSVALSTFTSKVIYGLRETVSLAQQLGQYVIERKLGAGGMGEVYLARHSLLRRHTAVKLLPPERAGLKTVERFEREVRATSRLSHPNTVAIYDYGRTRDGIFYYAMEYLEGMDLQRLVQEQGPVPAPRAVHILAQVAGALGEAHATGLIHRDLKPANVFLCERGGLGDTVKVLDFGLVKDTGADRPATGQTDVNALIGTPGYLAPESIHSPTEVDARSDIYALGALGYFLLTGREVFEGSTVVALCVAHLHQIPEPPSARLKRALPADLEQLILSCLEKDPAHRPQSAAALRSALLACAVPPWHPEPLAPEVAA